MLFRGQAADETCVVCDGKDEGQEGREGGGHRDERKGGKVEENIGEGEIDEEQMKERWKKVVV